ncbi:MAG: primosomal protein N', partial [Gammaproteobacteria bacterium]|nr:primosomal protein N' [Gammaproteobacteria bacterium]
LVPFGRRQLVGILLAVTNESGVDPKKLKRAVRVLDDEPLIPTDLLKHLQWASTYYHAPIGEVMQAALPVLLRQDKPAKNKTITHWCITPVGAEIDPASLARAPKQAVLLKQLQEEADICSEQLNEQHSNWRAPMNRLLEQGWVSCMESDEILAVPTTECVPLKPLNPDQQTAVDAVQQGLGQYGCTLLDGVTGSGKTEVYLTLIQQVIATNKQVLVLVPEIGLTPQLEQRFRQALPCPLVVMHSGLTDAERLRAWLAARSGEAQVIIGTRSAAFTPLKSPGLFIIDEEHDLSFKQQDGFRYSARDLLIVRARDAQVPIVLGSATPSLETLHNTQQQRYQHLILPERAGKSIPPTIRVLDVRKQPMDHLISVNLREAMRRHLDNQGQVLLFLNRRGYAPMLICHDCGWVSPCPRCDSRMTLHQQIQKQRCHHCGTERPIPTHCPSCNSDKLKSFGYGTERIEESLQQQFPDHLVLRIDRDSTRKKGSMQALLEQIHSGEGQILIGTQMLAKGHHFPNVTLVGVLDADYGLYSTDFRAAERMAQLIMQVAGRAGREERRGEVLIQTHHPDHPLLQTLITQGYAACAKLLLDEREQALFPPHGYLALLRADAHNAGEPLSFLQQLLDQARPELGTDVQLLGPIPSPMERRAGRYRAQLLLQSNNRQSLQQCLAQWLPQLEATNRNRKVRWSLDVDPLEMF